MVSISRGAPAASNMRSVALMISGPMPSPWATVMGVFVDIREHLGYWNAPRRATGLRRLPTQRVPLRGFLPADVQQLFDLRDHSAGFVPDPHRERRLHLVAGFESLPDLFNLRFGQPETGGHRSGPGPFEAYAGRFVPDDVVAPQILDQHQHEERIGHGIQRPAIM